ncbi:MAG: hypothetical protein A2169_06525 [Deltaproteobacteria bacterium RBG_13_47_9]|nr:MAG: hypothetical protein A2169_06525 [Deltaproteobacteria bacterium RBG_13_47_9]
MIFLAKRFRSKASSAASLSLGQRVQYRRMGIDFLPTPYYDTVSWREGIHPVKYELFKKPDFSYATPLIEHLDPKSLYLTG